MFTGQIHLAQNQRINQAFRFLLFTGLFLLLTGQNELHAQLTGVKNIPGDYPTLAAAITDLNTQGVGPGGVTLNVLAGNPQSVPAGGYVIGDVGSAILTGPFATSIVNQVIIQGNGNTATASAALTVGNLNDAIFKLIGADWITIQGFIMQENPANVINTPAASNNMTEWGVALLYVSTTDGSQNNSILSNTISLNRLYQNSFGVYSNTRHSPTDVTTLADITNSTTAPNHNNRVHTNNINNVNFGVVFIGSATAANMDNINDIGGSSLASGNNITNYGGLGSLSTYNGFPTTIVAGVYMNTQTNFNISFNTIISASLNTAVALRGILTDYSAVPAGTITNNVNSNTVSFTQAGTGTFQCITTASTAGAAGGVTQNVNNNLITNNAVTGVGSALTMFGVANLGAFGTVNLNNNIIRGNTSTATTGGFIAVTQQGAVINAANLNGNQVGDATAGAATFTSATTAQINPILNTAASATATVNINNNVIRGFSFVSTGQITGVSNQASAVGVAININNNQIGVAGGDAYTYSAASSGGIIPIFNSNGAASAQLTITGNDIRGIVNNVTGSGAHNYILNQTFTGSVTISNNTFTNIVANTTGSVTFIGNSVTRAASKVTIVNNNAVVGTYNKPGAGGTILFYNSFGVSPVTCTETNTGNNFSNMTFTGATTITGWRCSDGSGVVGCPKTVTNNTFNNITGGTSTVNVLQSSFASTGNISGNTITNISAAAGITGFTSSSGNNTISQNTITGLSSTAGVVTGLSITGAAGSTQSVIKNKIGNLQSNNATGTVNGILVSGGITVNLINNLIGDLRAPSTSSTTDAIRGISITSTTALSTINVYFNTVYLNAQSTGANFHTSALFHTFSTTATTATLDLRNNILVNNSTPNGTGFAVAFRRSAATNLNNYATTSNNNLFWAGGTGACTSRFIYHDGTTGFQMAAFQALVTPRETASVTEDPPFLSIVATSPTFLHINPAIPTQVESGGMSIGTVTDDFDGDARLPVPDIGADEYVGIMDVACTGMPSAGTATASPSTLCSGQSSMICLSGNTVATGITVQWRSSPTSGGPYTDIVCANSNCYNTGALTPGTYYYVAVVTCTNSGLSATSNEVTLVVNPNPTASVTPSSFTLCQGSSVSLTASGGVSYMWSPATGLNTTTGPTVIASPTVGTTYTVTVTDANGCTATATSVISIISPPTLTTSATPSMVCYGGSSQLNSTLTQGLPYSLTGLSGQTYTTLTGGGITIINTNAQLTPTMGSANQDDGGVVINIPFTFTYLGNTFTQMSMCTNGWVGAGNHGTIDAISMRTPGNLFVSTIPNNTIAAWFKDMGANFPLGTGSMRHGLIGTDVYAFQWDNANGSSFGDGSAILISFQINIYGPASSAPGRIELIYGPTVGAITFNSSIGIEDAIGGPNHFINALNGSGTSTTLSSAWPGNGNGFRFDPVAPIYSWSPATFLNSTSIPNPLATNMTATTTYTLTVTGSNGCTATSSVTVTVSPIVSISETDSSGVANNDSTLCAGGSATLTATGGGSYSWSTGETSNSIVVSPSTTTTYTVTVTDANLCSATASITITVHPLPTPVITISPPSGIVCTPQTITLNAGSGYSDYLWSTGETTQSIIVSMTGTYGVTVTDINGCTGNNSASVTVNQSPELSETHVDPTDCFSNDGSIDLMVMGSNGPFSYNWTTATGSGLVNGQQDQSGLSVGTYNVTVTDTPTGCSSVMSIQLVVPGGCGGCEPVESVSVDPDTICSGQTATFTAVGTLPGATFEWYDEATGMPVDTGNPIVSGPLFATTTYCVTQTVIVPTDVTIDYSGQAQTFIVPSGVTSISITAFGAEGAPGSGGPSPGVGGLGGTASGILSVTPGETLTIYVGGQDGFNGGGPAGVHTGSGAQTFAGNGGGATDIRTGAAGLLDRVLVAGGGGGAGGSNAGTCSDGNPSNGGGAGDLIGVNGENGTGCGIGGAGGGGGTQIAGGFGGASGTNCLNPGDPGDPGMLGGAGMGGDGANNGCSQAFQGGPGGGGGGGYYGGGGGGSGAGGGFGNGAGGGGGGGSSYIGGVASGSTSPNVNFGNGYVVLSYLGPCTSEPTCATVFVIPTTPPTITCPANITVQCASLVPPPNTASVTATDNQGGTPTITFVSDVTTNQTCVNRYTLTRTYRATDDCGNSATCNQTITVLDNTAPTITCPANVTVQCANQVPAINLNLAASDNCTGPAPVISHVSDVTTNQSCVNRYTLTRTYRATDACGNSGTCAQTITVFDNTAPTLTCPANVTVQCANQVPAINLNLATSDNCTGPAPTISHVSDVTTNQTCVNRYTLTRTYRSTDACGNSATCAQVITVNDNTPPTITCPANVTVQCANQVPAVNLSLPTSDNCSGPAPVITLVSNITTNQTCVNRYTLTRTYRATDACGNSTTCAQIITVFDNTVPNITFTHPLLMGLPNNGTVEIQCFGQDPNWDPPTFDQNSISATDNCTGGVTVNYNETFVDGGNCIGDGYINRYRLDWVATDACGNSSSRTAFVELIDTIPPVILGVPDDVTVDCDEIPEPPNELISTDECLCACVVEFSQSNIVPGCQGGQVITRTWTARDDCGNETVETQTITLMDEEGPVLQMTHPELLGVEDGDVLDYTCNEGGIPDFFDDLNAQSVLAIPSCGGTIQVTFTSKATETRNCASLGYMEQRNYTWTAVDACGNITTLSITAQLVDNEPPVLLGVPDIACIDDPALDEIDAIDNCDHGTFTYRDKQVPNPCGTGMATRRIYTASDQCGNITEDTVMLIPNDGAGPNMTFIHPDLEDLEPGEILVVECSASFSADDVVADENCPGTEVSFDQRVMSNNDCSSNGILSVMELTWTAIDMCGNTSELSVTIIVIDQTPPVFTNTSPEMTIDCLDPLPEPSATDNCGEVTMVTIDSIIPTDCVYEYDLIRRITATDPCGNSSVMTQIIHVGDGSGPIIEGVEEVVCDDLSIPEVTAWDPCAEQFVEVTMTEEELDVPCSDGTVIERTWTATDVCGHVSEVTQTFILDDQTPPEILIPTHSIIRRFMDNQYNLVFLSETEIMERLNDLAEESITAIDDCGEEVIPEFTLDVVFANDCEAEGFFERRTYTWIVSDICGNEASVSFTVDIMDDIPPVIHGVPAGETIICQELPPVPQVEADDPAEPVQISYSQEIFNGTMPGEFIVVRTWTATDDCGNVATSQQEIVWIPDTFLDCDILLPAEVDCNSHGVIISSSATGGIGDIAYLWEIEGEKCFIEAGQGTDELTIYVGFSAVEISLTITDDFGCSTVCTAVLDCIDPFEDDYNARPENEINFVDITEPSQVISEQADKSNRLNDIYVWPNPANESIHLKFESSIETQVTFSLTNFLGQVVLSDQMMTQKGLNTHKIDVQQLMDGGYVLEIKTEKEMHDKIVVIMK